MNHMPADAGAGADHETVFAETVFTNARLVLASEVVQGSLAVRGGRIVSVDPGNSALPGAVDCGGDMIAPGLVELHTDNLERHLMPRPNARWPNPQAIIAHDSEIAAAGITTVFDAMRAGSLKHRGGKDYARYAREVADDLETLMEAGALRVTHRLHLRAEVCSETVLEELDEFLSDPAVAIISIMDHTPGQRQFRHIAKYREYHQGKYALSDEEMNTFIEFATELRDREGQRHIGGIVERAKALGAVLASHDDTTAFHVAESVAQGVHFAEFPTTREAAEALRAAGVAIMMGAPNLLRGGSHSGNVAAAELVEAGLVDIFSSDYIPGALLMCAVRLGEMLGDTAAGFRPVTLHAAQAARMDDRGEIAPGKRADLVRIGQSAGQSVVRETWVAGKRVA